MEDTMRLTIAAIGLAVVGSVLAAPASAGERTAAGIDRTYPGEAYAQYYYRRGYYGGGYGAGAALGGLAAGALIGGAIASQGAAGPLPKTQDPDFIAYCSRKYRSFDPMDGTYLARDGRRYMCEYP
jgi:MFS family permease